MARDTAGQERQNPTPAEQQDPAQNPAQDPATTAPPTEVTPVTPRPDEDPTA